MNSRTSCCGALRMHECKVRNNVLQASFRNTTMIDVSGRTLTSVSFTCTQLKVHMHYKFTTSCNFVNLKCGGGRVCSRFRSNIGQVAMQRDLVGRKFVELVIIPAPLPLLSLARTQLLLVNVHGSAELTCETSSQCFIQN